MLLSNAGVESGLAKLHISMDDINVNTILLEMRQFRIEIMVPLENQMTAYEQLQNRFGKTELELMELKKCMSVVHKSEEVDVLKDQIIVLKEKKNQLENCLSDIRKEIQSGSSVQISYAKILSHN